MSAGRAGPLLLAALATGCGGDGDLGMLPPEPGPPGATLTAIQERIFTPRCAIDGCHAGPAPEQGMDLSEGASYASIVGVSSTELGPMPRVTPFEPGSSYLLLKLEGDARIVGERMPFGGPYLDDADLTLVREWILAGAEAD